MTDELITELVLAFEESFADCMDKALLGYNEVEILEDFATILQQRLSCVFDTLDLPLESKLRFLNLWQKQITNRSLK